MIILIHFFIQNAVCKQIYDFKENDYPFILFLDPLDVIELKFKRNERIYLSSWKKYPDLYLEVDAISSNGDIKTYGPFKNTDDLAGVEFNLKDYTLRFVNEGLNPCSVAISYSHYGSFGNYKYEFPIEKIDIISEGLGDLNRPFIYPFLETNEKCKTLVGLVGAALGALLLYPLIYGFMKRCHS